jgi:hypothetical protein
VGDDVVQLASDGRALLVHGKPSELLTLSLARGRALFELASVAPSRLGVGAQTPDPDRQHDDDD